MKVTQPNTPAALPLRRSTTEQADSKAAPEPLPTRDTHVFTQRPTLESATASLIERLREAKARRAATPVEMPDLSPALKWTPGSKGLSGADANVTINATYHALSDKFNDYLGMPELPSWMTFGQYASREAGSQIDALEDTFVALEAVRELESPKEILKALDEALGHLSPELAVQVMKLAKSQVELPTSKELLGLLASPAAGVSREVISLVDNTMDAIERLHKALVIGNVSIYENVVPAFDTFVTAEATGKDGLEVLRELGYAPGSEKDPQGFVTEAFVRYKAARDLGEKAKTASPAERDALLEERKALIHEANLYIGIQEQMVILQAPEIYGDPEVAEVVNAQGELSLTDPVGTHKLVGNWADFATRMGFEVVPEGTPGALAIQDHQGMTRHYRLPEPPPAGSIAAYFEAGLDPETAKALLKGSPRPL